jgi:GNAT superfamily N-acetyltransferase
MKIKQIPRELLDVWYKKFERLVIMPAMPRHSSNWSPGLWCQESILLGHKGIGNCLVIPMSHDELYLFFIYIDKRFRGKGHGKRFMKELIELSKELNYKRILLDVGYLNPKDRIPIPILRKFYNSLGFKRVKGTRMILEIK